MQAEEQWLPLDLTVTLEVNGLFIGSGPTTLDADKATLTAFDGTPLIPGSSLKGRLRHQCGRLAAGLQIGVCGGLREDTCQDELCPVCAIFGNPRQGCSLQFVGGRLATPSSVSMPHWHSAWRTVEKTSLRVGVAINRRRRTAQDEKLFVLRTVSPGLPTDYALAIRGTLPDGKGLAGLLVAGILSLQSIGGAGSRGLGWVRQRSISGRLGTDSVPEGDQMKLWLREQLELLYMSF